MKLVIDLSSDENCSLALNEFCPSHCGVPLLTAVAGHRTLCWLTWSNGDVCPVGKLKIFVPPYISIVGLVRLAVKV